MGSGLVVLVTLLGVGLTRARQWPKAVGTLILAACAGVPVVLMNHVSELYAYNVAPFWGVVVALSLRGLLDARGRSIVRSVTAMLLFGILISNVVAVNRKASQIRGNGDGASVLIPQLVDFARQLPFGGVLVLYDRQEPGTISYSEFLGGPFMALTDGAGGRSVGKWVKHLASRPDIDVRLVVDAPQSPADIVLIPDTAEGVLRVHELSTPPRP
jgi:hypothetical protein